MAKKINFRMIEDDNEHFLGIEINEDKLNRLNKMRELCRNIAEIEPQCSNPFYPFDNKRSNGAVKLEMHTPFWTFEPRVITMLSELLSMADDVSICAIEGTDTIRIMCSVHEMWNKHGYDNDMEHGK